MNLEKAFKLMTKNMTEGDILRAVVYNLGADSVLGVDAEKIIASADERDLELSDSERDFIRGLVSRLRLVAEALPSYPPPARVEQE